MTPPIKKSDFIQSLEKGLNVIASFDQHDSEQTLTQVATKLGMTRANARRILLTLQHLGYVTSRDGKMFSLSPKVLGLGYAYLSSMSIREIAQPYMEALADLINESCSMSVLDGNEIVYVARVQTKRIMTISLSVGTRLPAHAASMGRVLIAGMSPEDSDSYIEKLELTEYTSHTITSKEEFMDRIDLVRERGWALSDQELEIGVRSIAHAVRDKSGRAVAALNISGHASRVSLEEIERNYLPPLKETVKQIEAALIKI